jgi:hypothetical protein
MKKLLSAGILIALTVAASAQTQPPNRTKEYRIWAAERMIDRLVDRFGKSIAICKEARSEQCMQAVLNTYPPLNSIRVIAAEGDDVDWARLINIVHKVEKDHEEALSARAERQ